MRSAARLGSSTAAAVNNRGEVVGSSIPPESPTGVGLRGLAFTWTPTGGMIDLGAFGYDHSYASRVNDSGQVAGIAWYGEELREPFHAFIWTEGTGAVILGSLGGPRTGVAALNDAGDAVGSSDTRMRVAPTPNAYFWSQATGMLDMGTLGGELSEANALSDAGQAVGWADTGGGAEEAFSWTQSGGMVDLDPDPAPNEGSDADAVNECGQVAGSSEVTEGHPRETRSHAELWLTAPHAQPLPWARPGDYPWECRQQPMPSR